MEIRRYHLPLLPLLFFVYVKRECHVPDCRFASISNKQPVAVEFDREIKGKLITEKTFQASVVEMFVGII